MSLLIKDTITPALAAKARRLADRKPVLEAMGLEMVSLTKRAFGDSSLRPTPWAPRKGTRLETNPKTGKQKTISLKTGKQTGSLLRKSGRLYQSITIGTVTNDTVTVGSDAPYAAVQQFGSKKKSGRGSGIPARPFFPVDKDGNLTALARDRIRGVAAAKLRILLKE